MIQKFILLTVLLGLSVQQECSPKCYECGENGQCSKCYKSFQADGACVDLTPQTNIRYCLVYNSVGQCQVCQEGFVTQGTFCANIPWNRCAEVRFSGFWFAPACVACNGRYPSQSTRMCTVPAPGCEIGFRDYKDAKNLCVKCSNMKKSVEGTCTSASVTDDGCVYEDEAGTCSRCYHEGGYYMKMPGVCGTVGSAMVA